jgi:predicted adenylyl cyclase CyaB
VAGRKRLVELKARYEDAGKARALLAGSERLFDAHQVDTYFLLGERRLKLRQVAGRPGGQLIWYERADAAAPKPSDVLLLDVADAATLKAILTRVLGVHVVVKKHREVYRHQGVQVHVDEVEGLGRFLEFEVEVEDAPDAFAEGEKRLRVLVEYFQIPEEDLVASSYSDLLAE